MVGKSWATSHSWVATLSAAIATTAGADTATVVPSAASSALAAANTGNSGSIVGTTRSTRCSAHSSTMRGTNAGSEHAGTS